MSGPDLHADVDKQQLDDLAERFLNVILAVVRLGFAEHEPVVFHHAAVKALIYAQAALFVHPDAPPDATIEEVIVAHDLALRAAVADLRSDQ